LNRAGLFAKITEKWPVKVLSLAAAVIISIFYRMNNLETRFFTVPLLIESNDSLIPVNSFATSVRVSIRGEAEGIQPILAEDIEAYIDLERYANEGNYRVPVQVRKKGGALGVEPLEISVLPIEIPLILEQKVTRNVSVFPVLSGTVAEGYELTNQSLIPSSVTVAGPRSILDGHIEFNTETINLDRRYNDFIVMVNIKNDNPMLSIYGSNLLEFHGSISRIARGRGTENTPEPENNNITGGEE
jgi:YbbR domain-containing protein